MKVYRTGRRGSAWSKWYDDYKPVRKIFRDRLAAGRGPYRWKMKLAKNWSGEADLAKVMRNADREIPGMGQENAFWAKTKTGSVFVVDSGEEHISIPPAPDNVSPSIARARDLTFTKTELLDREDADSLRVVTMGYAVCKLISGTRTPSAALPRPAVARRRERVRLGRQAGGRIGRHLRDGQGRRPPRVERLPRGPLARRPVPLPDHAHTSGSPKRSGWPSCL